MKKYNIYRDKLHGIEVACGDQTAAWMLVRNECHGKNLSIPTYEKIEFVRKLTDDEMAVVRKRQIQEWKDNHKKINERI